MLLIHAAEYYIEVDARMGTVKQIETGLLLSYWVCTVVKCRDAQIQSSSFPGYQFFYGGPHICGAWNSKETSRFLKTLCTPGIVFVCARA